MHKWSNLVQIAVSVLLLAIPLTACRRAPSDETGIEEEPTTAPAAEAVVEIDPTEDTQVEVFYVSIFQSDEFGSPEALLIDQFEADHPDIRVNRSRYWASPSAYINFLRESPFTVVMSVPADYVTFQAVEEGLFLDLDAILVETDLDGAYPADFLAMTEYAGKQYFLPGFYSWFAIYYNRDIFDRYDLTPPGTWKEFLNVCEKLAENGIAPLVYAGDNRQMVSVWFDYLNLRLNGIEFHTALMEGREGYDDERVRAAFDTWKFLVDSGYILENAWGLQAEESLSIVVDGKAGMILTPGYQSHDELGFFRFPIMDPSAPVGEIVPTVGYVILAKSPQLLAAVELLGYMGSAKTQTHLGQQLGTGSGLLPLHKDVERDFFTPEMDQASHLVQDADHIRQPYQWCFDDSMLRPMSAIFRDIMIGRDYEENLEKLESARKQVFDE